MVKRKQAIVIIPALIIAALAGGCPWFGKDDSGSSGPALFKFTDDFETDQNWGMFEEIVGGNPSYGDGIGEVVTSTDAAYAGLRGLRLWANKAQSLKSNHIIAQKRLSYSGAGGAWRYSFYAYISPDTSATGQSGPEFSVQNTRVVSAQYLTSTAGFQYRSTPYASPLGNWAIWAESAPGIASWQTCITQPLTAGQWYSITMEIDYNANRYISFRLQGDAVDVTFDASGYGIAWENKGFDQEALWISVENENLWSGASAVYENKTYYDNLCLEQLSE